MPDTITDPAAPAIGDQGVDQSTVEDGQEGAPQGDQSLFTEQETAGLPEELKGRVGGMVKKFTQTQQALHEERKALEEERMTLREHIESLKQIDRSPDPRTAEEPKSSFAEMLEQVPAQDRQTLIRLKEALGEDFRREFRQEVAPLQETLAKTRLATEWDRTKSAHSDFDQVMTRQAIGRFASLHPGISSPEVAYRFLKMEQLESQSKNQLLELQKLRANAAAAARTEQPVGPSTGSIDLSDFHALPKEKRKSMTMHDMLKMAEAKLGR